MQFAGIEQRAAESAKSVPRRLTSSAAAVSSADAAPADDQLERKA